MCNIYVEGAGFFSFCVHIIGPTYLLCAVVEDKPVFTVFIADPAGVEAEFNTIRALSSDKDEEKKMEKIFQ